MWYFIMKSDFYLINGYDVTNKFGALPRTITVYCNINLVLLGTWKFAN